MSTKRRKPIPGICADAKTLGVNRQHLQYVLVGRRESKILKKRYAALQKKKQAESQA